MEYKQERKTHARQHVTSTAVKPNRISPYHARTYQALLFHIPGAYDVISYNTAHREAPSSKGSTPKIDVDNRGQQAKILGRSREHFIAQYFGGKEVRTPLLDGGTTCSTTR